MASLFLWTLVCWVAARFLTLTYYLCIYLMFLYCWKAEQLCFTKGVHYSQTLALLGENWAAAVDGFILAFLYLLHCLTTHTWNFQSLHDEECRVRNPTFNVKIYWKGDCFSMKQFMSGNLFYLHRLSNIQKYGLSYCVWLWNVVLKYYKFIYSTNKTYSYIVMCLLSYGLPNNGKTLDCSTA